MTTQQAIEALHALPRMGQGAPGLARMQNLCDHLGNPEKELQCIHIAGTNGKGSLAAMTSSILTAAGYKTGLTISPYVVDFRERFQIDGEMIPPRTLANLTEKVLDAIDAIEAEGGEKPVEFEAKLDVSVVDGWTCLECYSFDAYNEAGNLRTMVERFREREGHYPRRILADKIYRNRGNLSYCKERGIRLSGPALGRPRKDEIRDKAQNYLDECERVEVERRFSLAKRKCGMGLVTAKLRETAAHVIAMSFLY